MGNVSSPWELLLQPVSPLPVNCLEVDGGVRTSLVCVAGLFLRLFLHVCVFYPRQLLETFRPDPMSANLTCG